METLPKTMKTCSHVICAMFVFVALCGCPCGPPTDGCIPDISQVRDFYWYIRNRDDDGASEVRQDLEVLTTKISVKFADGISEVERDALIVSEPLLRPFSERQIAEGPELWGWYLLRTVDCATRAEVWELIERFDDALGVAFAAGVYIVADIGATEEMQMTDRLYASVSSERDPAEIEALNTANHVEVVEIIEYPGIDKVSYRLRITELSPLNALDTANAYEEAGLGILAQPTPYVYMNDPEFEKALQF